MRVLMAVVSNITTDARVRREATALAGAGHAVEVVAFDYGIRRPQHYEEFGVRYSLYPFPSRDAPKWRRLAGAAWFILRASARIVRCRADVFHSHNLHLAIPCLVSARARGASLVYDAHELVREMSPRWRRPLVTAYERLIWRRAAAVITTNASRAAYLADLHGLGRPLVLGNYPIDPGPVQPEDLRGRLGVAEDRLLLIYQGGLYVAARGFEVVARALAQLPDWEWVLVGFGSTETVERVREMLRDAGIADRSYLLEAVPVSELPPITAAADAGLVPLRATDMCNYLGDTNKLFEYLMAGIPAVGSDFPEVRRAILGNGEGPVGAVFDPDDERSIRAALERVAADLPQLKERAAVVARACYSWERERTKLVGLYRRLADGLRSSPVEEPLPPRRLRVRSSVRSP